MRGASECTIGVSKFLLATAILQWETVLKEETHHRVPKNGDASCIVCAF